MRATKVRAPLIVRSTQKAIAALAADNSEVRPFFRTMLGTDINALRSLAQTEPAEWEANAGTSLDKLRYFTGYGFSPNLVSFWGLTDETSATDQIEALKARGFKTAGAPGVVGNGEPMQYDPEKMDPSDPWRSSVGGSQFAAASGNNVVQTQARWMPRSPLPANPGWARTRSS